MCIYIYVYIYIHNVLICIHICIHICPCIRICVCVHVYTYIYMCIYIYICIWRMPLYTPRLTRAAISIESSRARSQVDTGFYIRDYVMALVLDSFV